MQVGCMGILVVDVFADPIRRLPDAGQLVTTSGLAMTVGGCAANAAIALRILGENVQVAGKVGSDTSGDFILSGLKRHGAGIDYIRRSRELPTSGTVIFTLQGEDRRYLHCIGANREFSLDDVDLDFLRGTSILYFGGYLATPAFAPEHLAKLFWEAKHRGLVTVLDVVMPAEGSFGIEDVAPVLPYTDYFLPNEDEGARLTGYSEELAQAECLSAFNAECTVVITRGPHGSLAIRGNRVINTPAFPIETVEESGAGDAFTAGLIKGILRNWELDDALSLASAVGASCTRSLGCFAGIFTFDEAVAFLHSQQIGHTHPFHAFEQVPGRLNPAGIRDTKV
jgi:sugar/nucleoside kinase (ribokinase family)